MQGMQPMDMQQMLQMQQMMMQQMPYVVPQGFGIPAGGEAGAAGWWLRVWRQLPLHAGLPL